MIKTIYFDLGTKASQKEIKFIKERVPDTIIDDSLKFLGNTEENTNAHVPFRNLYFAMKAASYAKNVFIAGIKDDNMSDKNEAIFAEWSSMLSKTEGIKVNIFSPFWDKTKKDLIDEYIWLRKDLTNTEALDDLISTPSCYIDSEDNYCGHCQCCFRKAVAFMSFRKLPFTNNEIMEKYLKRIESGMYNHQSERKIAMELFIRENLYKDKKVYAIDIDGILANEPLGFDYSIKTPNETNIKKVNELYDNGNRIVLYTSRYSVDDIVTEKWLYDNKVKYHNIIYDKIFYDIFIDDKGYNNFKEIK